MRHRLWEFRTHLTADIDTASVRKTGIEHRDVRTGGRNPAERFGSCRGLTDDAEIRFGTQERSYTAADNFVVIEREYSRDFGGTVL